MRSKQNPDFVVNSLMVDQGIPKLQQTEKEMTLNKDKKVKENGHKDILDAQISGTVTEDGFSALP